MIELLIFGVPLMLACAAGLFLGVPFLVCCALRAVPLAFAWDRRCSEAPAAQVPPPPLPLEPGTVLVVLHVPGAVPTTSRAPFLVSRQVNER